MRGRKMSSAKRVWPVTFARASTLRRGTPITRNASPLLFEAPAGVFRKSFSFGMRPPECLSMPTSRHLRCRAFPDRDLKHRGYENCGRAIAALRRPEIGKSILQWMKVSVFSKAFHRQDLLSTALERQHETRKHGLAI